MTISQTHSLSKPFGDNRIAAWTFGYLQARNKGRVYDLVLAEFEKSQVTQATLARRMGKRPEQVNRLLAAPGNWTLDTVSDLLFAISGAEASYELAYPLDEPRRNYDQPFWVITSGYPEPVSDEVPVDIFAGTNTSRMKRFELTRVANV